MVFACRAIKFCLKTYIIDKLIIAICLNQIRQYLITKKGLVSHVNCVALIRPAYYVLLGVLLKTNKRGQSSDEKVNRA